MKASNTFIRHILDNIIILFPYLKVRYEYDTESFCHFIEVTALNNNTKNDDLDYVSFESLVTKKFIELFPNEGICFIENDALYEIEKPLIEKTGALFENHQAA
jgi:hypothetical protein